MNVNKVDYQPYWVEYCRINGLPLDHRPQSNAEYCSWIMQQHREFEPSEWEHRRLGYPERFTAWLRAKPQILRGVA